MTLTEENIVLVKLQTEIIHTIYKTVPQQELAIKNKKIKRLRKYMCKQCHFKLNRICT